MDSGASDIGLVLFRYGEKLTQTKLMAQQQWPEIPPEAMAFFGGEVLASGVVLSALINATGLDAMKWPGDLPVILGLKMTTDSPWKVGDVLVMMAEAGNLIGAQVDQMQNTFLELLQWKVVDQLHASLFAEQRRELAKTLVGNDYSLDDRSKVLASMAEFLQKTKVDAYAAKEFFEKALKECLLETYEVFDSVISVEAGEKILKLITKE